jgi:hypothetical protein
VGVAEQARGGVAVHLLGDPGVGVRVVAEREELVLAEPAAPARDAEGHDDLVADGEVLHVGAQLHHLAHELVAEDVALLHGGDEAVVEMEVRAADRRRGDLQDRVPGVEDFRVRDVFDRDLVHAVPADRFH